MRTIGCNCGKNKALTGVAGQPVPHTRYEVTYPNGAVVVFDHEWQAHQALASSGGSLRVLEPETSTSG